LFCVFHGLISMVCFCFVKGLVDLIPHDISEGN
jgi:hypothetical protein